MREILFRGRLKTENGENKKGCWVYGDLVTLMDGKEKHPHIYGKGEVKSETVGQYTGLTDKNSKKIFEGDIVHLTDIRYNNEWKAVVVFGNPYCQYSWGWNFQYIGKKPQINTDILLWVEMEDMQVYCEVIGNIHDNPELLKECEGK
jgi:uncharacterized phage protein (TIGR01671 family)